MRRRRRVGWLAAVLTLSLGLPSLAMAAFTSIQTNTSSFTAASHFNTVPEAARADSAWLQYSLENSASATSGSAATDSSGNTRHGTWSGPTDAALMSYTFDNAPAKLVRDQAGGGGDGTFSGSSMLTKGVSGNALSAMTQDGYASAAVGVHTNASFTVSAWVNLTELASQRAAISQIGTRTRSFWIGERLQFYFGGTPYWVFSMPSDDSDAPANEYMLWSSTPVVTDSWQHVVAVYDSAAGTNQMSSYVNGALTGQLTHLSTWDGTALRAGISQWVGAADIPWRGGIDDVRLWQRALSGAEVSSLYTGSAVSATSLRLSWPLDSVAGTTATDTSGNAVNGTLSGGGNVGERGSAFTPVKTALAVRRSFTVSAWVRQAPVSSGNQTYVSQGTGGDGNTFWLQRIGATGKWALSMSNGSSFLGPADTVSSTTSTTFDTWTHIAGVYDSAAGMMRIYVNGVLEGSLARTQTLVSTDYVQICVAYTVARYLADGCQSALDDITIWQRALTQPQIAAVVSGRASPPDLAYHFDESSGTVATDATGQANTGTLFGSVNRTTTSATGADGDALSLPGSTSAYVQATSAPVRTDSSFSASIWVTATSYGASSMTALSQPGTTSSAYLLGYNGSLGKFEFALPQSHVGTPTIDRSVSTASPTAATWTLLSGVYNATAQTIQLYVNGVAQGSAVTHSTVNAWNARGAPRVGGAWLSGAAAQPWSGGLDETSVYQRVLTGAEITSQVTGGEPGVGVAAATTGALQGPQQGVAATTGVTTSGMATALGSASLSAPTTFSLELWFRSAKPVGGQILGFGSSRTGESNFADRRIYLTDDGRVTYGVRNGLSKTYVASPAGLNDGAWHHVVATSSSTAGSVLYVDGTSVDSNASALPTVTNTGWWRLGPELLLGWQNRPSSDGFAGSVDEVSIYSTVRTAQQVKIHYLANH